MKCFIAAAVLSVMLYGCCSTIPFTTNYPAEWSGRNQEK